MNIRNFLKWYLFFASIYLISDGLIHVFDVKLIDAAFWPAPALIYAKFIGNLYGGFAILAGLLGIEASRNLEKYTHLLYIAAIWSLTYGGYLFYSSLTINFVSIFSDSPSIYLWMPFYNYYLLFEAGLLFILSTLVFLWSKEKTKNKYHKLNAL